MLRSIVQNVLIRMFMFVVLLDLNSGLAATIHQLLQYNYETLKLIVLQL